MSQPDRSTGPSSGTSSRSNDRRRRRSADISLLLLAAFACHLNAGLLLAAAPTLASRSGGGEAAGLTNVVLLGSTIAAMLCSPRVTRRLYVRSSYHVGVFLLVAPCVVFLFGNPQPWLLYLSSLIRGAGFGLITVTSSTSVLQAAPLRRVGAAIGAFGVMTTVASIIGPPLGLWILVNSSPAGLGLTTIGAGLGASVLLTAVPAFRATGSPERPLARSSTTLGDLLAIPAIR